ncbi:nucleoside-diphosphate-sugar epimerase [Saccharothrix tamanrassetensis]|uniref:Nucleoside-diphosphate-sugar epimerase n=1 Tax=Saccharothrix tamanrassetensis TaxID=1051531 RepID=A0A841CSU4_9PSEU|nr:NAD-dependent epimerase/dehydratase family protein [Saccharothrix tamanrassetensis]MBB5959394.1 nucleoside-diphosphate-sugar epimerase [Saccharothrix tamanrassetensis]
MRVVVTGASGNIGTALCRVLPAELPDADVLGIARRVPADEDRAAGARHGGAGSGGTQRVAAQRGAAQRSETRTGETRLHESRAGETRSDGTRAGPGGVSWLSCDIGAPSAEARLTRAFAGADAVVHLAWAIQPGMDEPAMRRTNLDGSAHVLAAAERAGVPHVVVASSVAAYTPADHPVDEDWPCAGVPGSTYSLQKAQLERMLDGHDVARVRPCAVVQPDAGAELDRWVLSPLIPPFLIGRRWLPVPLWNGLRAQVVHAEDVARAITLILRRRVTGAFNVASGSVLHADELAGVLGGFRLPVPLRLLEGVAWPTWRVGLQPMHPGWLRLADQASIVDTSRLRALGWRPRHDAREALAEFVAAVSEGRGSWGPLAPRAGARWRRLGLARPVRQSQGG